MKRQEFQAWIREILKKGLFLELAVKGISMYPVLQEGDRIKIKKVDTSEINTGDLICAVLPSGESIAHRVIRKNLENKEPTFITQGDAILSSFEEIHSGNVLGKVFSIKRLGTEILLDNRLSKLKNKFYVKILAFKKRPLYFIKEIEECFLKRILFNIQSQSAYSYFVKKIFSKKQIDCRLATLEDSVSLARFLRRTWSIPLKNLGRYYYLQLKKDKENSCSVIAQMKSKIFGYGIVKKSEQVSVIDPHWLLERLYVDWRYRRLGVGTQILNYLIDKCLLNQNAQRQLIEIDLGRGNISQFAVFTLRYIKKSNFSCSYRLFSVLEGIIKGRKKFIKEGKIILSIQEGLVDLYSFIK